MHLEAQMPIYLWQVTYAWYLFCSPPFSLCPWICLFSHFSFLTSHFSLLSSLFSLLSSLFSLLSFLFSLSNIHRQSFLYESFAMSLPIPPGNGSDQGQPNDASKRDIVKASVYGYSAWYLSKFTCFIFPFVSRVLGLELPMTQCYTTSQYSLNP